MKVRVETLRYADVVLLEDAGLPNARFMRHQTYQQLVENLRKDQALTQIPFCARWFMVDGKRIAISDSKWVVISGNHRVKAARDAGLDDGPFLVTDDPMTLDEIRALQLSHNSIAGQDDPAILKEIYQSIAAIDLKQYAGLDDKTLELLAKIGTEPAPSASLEWTCITFAFLPDEVEKLKRALDLALNLSKGEAFAVRMKEYEPFMQALALTGAAHSVTNTATALGLILDSFERHLTDLQSGWVKEKDGEAEVKHRGWVPIASVLGSTTIPSDVALVLRKAIERAKDKGDVTANAPWRLLELLAADYLAG